MKVAITSQGSDMQSRVDPRFGRARHFIVADTDSGEFTCHDNQVNVNAMQGAGIQAGRKVVELGVVALITGHIGPKAFDTLQAGGVQVYSGASGTVEEAFAAFQAGTLQAVETADVRGHWT
ncbi:MAG: NifB/NifX family molybdenum-iron cluster-binding protein [Pirellulaceae bacterium]